MSRASISVFVYLILIGFVFFYACRQGFLEGLFKPKSQRESYTRLLHKESKALAEAWDSLGQVAIKNPLVIGDVYSEKARFREAEAVAYSISLPPGRMLDIRIVNNGSRPLYADLLRVDSGGGRWIFNADTSRLHFETETVHGDTWILRIQPQTDYRGDYSLEVNNTPLLGWPIPEGIKSHIGSHWGVARDGGARSHEGIDIFAARGSPVLAMADGFISRVGENNLGGKVVFQQHRKLPFTLYYAHLDSQIAVAGSSVRKGDTIGLVGNTGNARTTPPHLHLGIYTRDGAINPWSFIQPKTAAIAPEDALPAARRAVLKANTHGWILPDEKSQRVRFARNDTLTVNALTSSFFRVENQASLKGFVNKKAIESVLQP